MQQDPEFIPTRFYETEEAIVLTDAEGRILWFNPAFTILCGYELPEAKGKKPGSFLQGAETDPKVVENVRSALRSGMRCTVQLTNYHKDGHSYAVEIDIAPIKDNAGKVTFFAAIERKFTPGELSLVEEETLRSALHSILQDFVAELKKTSPK